MTIDSFGVHGDRRDQGAALGRVVRYRTASRPSRRIASRRIGIASRSVPSR
jgi:hypothetical protein